MILESADGRVGVGQVTDVSLTGLRVQTDLEVEPATPLTLRVTLPKDTGRLEVLVKVARRDAHGFGVSFLNEGEAERIAPFVAPGDIRRWSRRVAVNLPIRIETGSEENDVIHGRTVDLSASGGRLTIDGRLAGGDVVVVELPGPEIGETLRLPSLVWEAYTGGAVVVFVNLARAEYLKLHEYLNHFG